MVGQSVAILDQFKWEPQPRAQALMNEIVDGFLNQHPAAAALAQDMKDQTATRFYDWIDHVQIPETPGFRARLQDVGFSHRPMPGSPDRFIQERGLFPQVLLSRGGPLIVAIKVESVEEFAIVWRLPKECEIEGDPLAPLRRIRAFVVPSAELWAVERHGYQGHAIASSDPARAHKALKHLEAFKRRPRDLGSDELGFVHLNDLVDAAIPELGVDMTCDFFFHGERDYWQRRNRAARVQKERQNRLGLGWANHDHHTYRCSRAQYWRMVHFFEKLGFFCRERFYAGLEAEWGAQVLEHTNTGITIFADVDMSPEEVLGDFAHTPMSERDSLGTVGLWVGLHGESLLQAGMHHLECQFDWHALVDQLQAEAAIRTMDPFTTFPYLRQAFTEGERWRVSEARIRTLLKKGLISEEQARRFGREGALGSHLENLERNDGFKGFNQQGVSDIIARTDPRRAAEFVGA